MVVPMVHVGIVGMLVRHGRVMVPMAVRFARWIVGTMCVLMVRVVLMSVLVIHISVRVLVRMSFRQVEV